VNIVSVVAGVAAVTPARGSPRYSRFRLTWCVVLLVLSFALATPTPSRADIGVIVLEPVGALGFFTRVGHAGTYFLAAIIDYNLYESAGHREDIAYVDGMFALFRQASDTISRQAGAR
jgi:hypothetical protein